MLKAIKDALVKQAVEKLVGAVLASAVVGGTFTVFLRGIKAMPLRWQVVGGGWAATIAYFVVLRYSARWIRPVPSNETDSSELKLLLEAKIENNTVLVNVHSQEPTQAYSAEIFAMTGNFENERFPLHAKWKDTADDKREVIKGQSRLIELAKIVYSDHGIGLTSGKRFRLNSLLVLGAHRDAVVAPRWFSHELIFEPTILSLWIAAVETGKENRYNVHIVAATDGQQPPMISATVQG